MKCKEEDKEEAEVAAAKAAEAQVRVVTVSAPPAVPAPLIKEVSLVTKGHVLNVGRR